MGRACKPDPKAVAREKLECDLLRDEIYQPPIVYVSKTRLEQYLNTINNTSDIFLTQL